MAQVVQVGMAVAAGSGGPQDRCNHASTSWSHKVRCAMAFVVGGKSFTSIKDAEAEYARLSAEVAAEKAAIEAKAAALAARSNGGNIELLSMDGGFVQGVKTIKATDNVVFESTDKKSGKVKTTTERDLCSVTGFVLISRDHSGKVRAGWGNPPDFGRYSPLSANGIEALRELFAAPAEAAK